MNYVLHVLIFCFVVVEPRSRSSSISLDNASNQRPNIWAEKAVEFVRNLTCDHIFYNVLHQCQQMKQTPNDQFRIYAAEASKQTKLLTVLADGPLSRSNDHDGVLVLDPFPDASFGHLVLIFFIEHIKPSLAIHDRAKCEVSGGSFIENHNDCLRLALRDGCQKSYRRGYQKRRRTNQRCDIDLLPSVYETTNSLESDIEVSSGQTLRCRSIPGFATCPETKRDSYGSTCDEDDDTNECSKKLSEKLNIRCRMFETCDHAVIIQGGWNRIMAKDSDLQLLQETRTMLSFNGYPDDNVKTFYANGEIYLPGIPMRNLYPSSAKQLMRSHLRNVCQQSHCIDTLAVFIKGPAMHDGSLLLWDIDGSGIANDDEIYRPSEFVEDMSKCHAKQIYIVADHSYSGRLAEKFRESKEQHKNIILATSGDQYQLSWNGEFTKLWFKQNRRSTCFKYVVSIGRDTLLHSDPDLFDGSENELDTTLSGAPCNLNPPSTDDEIKEKYFGCQNVPSMLWFRRIASARGKSTSSSIVNNHNSNDNSFTSRSSKSFLSSNLTSSDTNLTKRRTSS